VVNTKKRWRLVRVDLGATLFLAQNEGLEEGSSGGGYCVQFYTKASCDAGNRHSSSSLDDNNNDEPVGDQQQQQQHPKPDNQSRYWLAYYRLDDDKSGERTGPGKRKWKEFPPNTANAIRRRFSMDLHLSSKKNKDDPLGNGQTMRKAWDISAIDDDDDDEVERHNNNLHDRYAVWEDVVNLMDVETRLVGPFDFDDDIELPPLLTQEDLVPSFFDQEKKKLLVANYRNLIVKDRVPWSRWQELMEALGGREDVIDHPILVAECSTTSKKKEMIDNSKPRASGEKRASTEEAAALLLQDTSVQTPPRTTSTNPSCLVCHECKTSDEGKGELLTFETTTSSAQASLHVHVSCASKSNMIVSKEILEATLAQARHAQDGRGNVYYVTNDLHGALSGMGDMWAGDLKLSSSSSGVKTPLPIRHCSIRVRAARSQMTPTTCKSLQGLSTADFTKDEIDSSSGPGGISGENATLHRKAKQKRLSRGSGLAHSPTTTIPTPTQQKNAAHRTNSIFRRGIPHSDELLSQYSPEPAEDFPEGWMTIKRKRSCKGSKLYDMFWYSPKERYMLRSRPDVYRFLEALKKSGGDETKAIETIGK
jgi:hypothetical protein